MTPYPAAIGLSTVSFLVILLVLPPLVWHIKARNVGASSVILWVIMLNFMTFINALIWPDDDLANRFDGSGLCDFQVKLQVASQVAIPASFACILRALASVLDTNNISVTKLHKRRNMMIDLLWCLGFPLLQMPLHYIVQPTRYVLTGVSGCAISVSNDWVMVMLILMPPVIWTAISAVYAGLVIARLWRYRSSFKLILQNNGTNKSRFLRLYIICMVWIFGNVPVACYAFWLTFQYPKVPFQWSDVHDAAQWSVIYKLPSDGVVLRDRYIWLTIGIVMFLFFGIGSDALKMYKAMFVKVGCRHRSRRTLDAGDEESKYGSSPRALKQSLGGSIEDSLASSIDLEAMQHPASHL